MKRFVSREEFDKACEGVWSEVQYQNQLPRRTDDEAKEPGAFATLARVYLRRFENDWANNPGIEAALPGARKLAAIFIRCMVYCGIRNRV